MIDVVVDAEAKVWYMSLDLVNLINKEEGKVNVDKKFFLQSFVVKNLNPPNKHQNISENLLERC